MPVPERPRWISPAQAIRRYLWSARDLIELEESGVVRSDAGLLCQEDLANLDYRQGPMSKHVDEIKRQLLRVMYALEKIFGKVSVIESDQELNQQSMEKETAEIKERLKTMERKVEKIDKELQRQNLLRKGYS